MLDWAAILSVLPLVELTVEGIDAVVVDRLVVWFGTVEMLTEELRVRVSKVAWL